MSCIFLGIEVSQSLLSAWIAFDLVWFLASRPRFAVKQNNAPVVYQGYRSIDLFNRVAL